MQPTCAVVHAALSTDPFMATSPAINIVRIAEDPAEQRSEPAVQLQDFAKRINRLAFTDLNAVLISAGEDGIVRRWDVEVGGWPSLLCHWSRQSHIGCGHTAWLSCMALAAGASC